jgi:hypothetical protein
MSRGRPAALGSIMSTLEQRRDQMFPKLRPEEIDRLRRFGERIMRALILRRVALIENCAGGPVLIGPALNPDMVRLQGFLARNGYPHQVLDPAEDADAKALVERYAPVPWICRSLFVPTGPCSRLDSREGRRAHAVVS